MPNTWVADDNGIYQPVKGIWVANDSGEFKKALAMWVSNDSGEYKSGGVGGPTIGSFTAVLGAWSYTNIRMDWSASGATNYKVFQVGNPTPIFEHASATSFIYATYPSTTYQFFLRATNATGAYVDSPIVTVTTTALPAPTGLSVVSGTLAYNDFDLHWNPVGGATAYELQNTSGGLYYYGPGTGPFDVNPAPSTTYYFRVRSYIGGAYSGWSPTLTVTTPKVPGPSAGTYSNFYPASAYTWAAGSAAWRAQSDGLYHGNGSDYGSTRGTQTACFFYGNGAFDNLKGGRVTKFEINLERLDDAGASAGQSNRFHLHTMAGKPSGSPLNNITNSTDAGTLARGEEKWISLPVAWGQKLVDEEANAKGIAWGNVSGRYMHAASVATRPNNGRLRFTIG